MKNITVNQLVERILGLFGEVRRSIVQSVNHTTVLTYFEIGRMIIEEEQDGNVRADYSMHLLKTLSRKLTIDFGKGFSKRNLEQMRQFYLTYSKAQTMSAQFENQQENNAKFIFNLSLRQEIRFKLFFLVNIIYSFITSRLLFHNNLQICLAAIKINFGA